MVYDDEQDGRDGLSHAFSNTITCGVLAEALYSIEKAGIFFQFSPVMFLWEIKWLTGRDLLCRARA